MESIITLVQAVAVLTAGVLTAICLLSAIKAQVASSYQVCSQNFEYHPVEAVSTHEPRSNAGPQPLHRQDSLLITREREAGYRN
jgi:hypothetical protein